MARNDLILGGINFGPPCSPPADVKRFREKPGPRFPRSRDYAISVIGCKVGECPANKNGACTMPSCISIGADGRCELGVKSRKDSGNAGRTP
jgi:hypothetical protein